MGKINIYSENSIDSTVISVNGEELEGLYEFFFLLDQRGIYSKVSVKNRNKLELFYLSPFLLDEIEVNTVVVDLDLPNISIENTEEGVCVKHNGVLLSNLVKLYVHIKAKKTNNMSTKTMTVTDDTELFEAYYVTEISENSYNIIHVL
jgi:hypothetical protein